MNHKRALAQLEKEYPGKPIIKIPENNPSEILCEIDPSSEHPGWSRAIAIIDRSASHHHTKSTETYKVIKGKLTLYLDGTPRKMKKNDELTIKPGVVHWVEGDETWVDVYSEPGWTIKDHILKR